MDAVHLMCAEKAKVDVLLTTDDKFRKIRVIKICPGRVLIVREFLHFWMEASITM
ncbi:MAG: hypothetical protein KAQ93_09295 [Spirochaetales bacterium]|nr:hypothetical protein [Spirochaetales bacterium]